MSNIQLLEKLDKATDRAATLAIQHGMPIPVSKKVSLIGNLSVEKNIDGYYDVKTLDNKMLYENLAGFDVAVIIAQRYISGEFRIINQVLVLEKQFSKHQHDMLHYLSCIKRATKDHDFERVAILEDKFQTAELFAKSIKDKLSHFKKVKY